MITINGTILNNEKYSLMFPKDSLKIEIRENKLTSIDLHPLRELPNLKEILIKSDELNSIDLSILADCKSLVELLQLAIDKIIEQLASIKNNLSIVCQL